MDIFFNVILIIYILIKVIIVYLLFYLIRKILGIIILFYNFYYINFYF